MFKLRDYIEVARLAHEIVEQEGLSYKDAIEKAKELIGSERVGAHVNSDSINSKEIKDSITEN
ncbi:hypothetical protein [uncultured Clostridium sp.]|jgi:hypothetical protein|uniref:hypothetical protein n=1 Tax=uncultured Clostridium sp. TaxID=59620 RepID=UPI0020647FB7|nr:hypothetical protein [uncultured Clostridium sp.]DAU87270.1 MAG TPA: hypothetical protein [Caudoviricetes sp.]